MHIWRGNGVSFRKRQAISSVFRNFKPFSCRVQYFALLRTEGSLDAVLVRSGPNCARDPALAHPVCRGEREGGEFAAPNHSVPVSYTHLTLPTKRIV